MNKPQPFEPIARASLSSQVADAIRSQIDTGSIAANSRLPSERELAASFQVSRVAVREAIQMLQAKGYVIVRPGKGTFAVSPSERSITYLQDWISGHDDDLRRMVELRMIIEPGVAALAAQRATQQDADELLESARALSTCTQADASRVDAAFHARLALITGNPFITELLNAALDITEELRSRTLKDSERRKLAEIGHLALAEAIATGDEAAARQAMLKHLQDAADSI
eukprot:g17691.t1